MQEEYWVTKDNKKIAVSELTESHAKNILRMLLKWRRLEKEDNEKLFGFTAHDPFENQYDSKY